MPLGIVSSDDFAQALRALESKSSPLESKSPDGSIEKLYKGGRDPGAIEIPDPIRKIIGEAAIEDGNQSAQKITEFLGINKNQVTAYKNGATSTATYHNPDASLKNYMTRTRERISKRASRKLLSALDHMTEDKLKEASAPELAGVARAMSAVVKDMIPPSESTGQLTPQLVIYAPKITDETKFPIIDVVE